MLKRRREQAAGGGTRPIQLLPGEMVDDALARGSSAVSKWIRENFGIIQWVILGAIAVGGGYLFYQTRVDKKDAGATTALMAGVTADRGLVMAEDKRTEEQKEADPSKVFKTAEERTDAALAAYKKAAADHAGTATALLARLGEAGEYLDKQDWPHALEGFSAVASSTLAAADPDVKGRALEGLGFAKEGKGDLDGALATFKELEGIDARGFKELGLYHQGRIYLAKGDKDKAKDFLKQVRDKLEQPTTEGPATVHYVQRMTDEMLRRIDPSLVPNKAPVIGGPKGDVKTSEEIERIKRQLMEQLKQKDHHP
jgi:tetratricopeptide (TPR) repeat protein